MNKKRRLLQVSLFVVAGVLMVCAAWGVTLGPMIQAPKAALIVGYDDDTDKIMALRVSAGGGAGSGASAGLVSLAYGRNSVGTNQVINTGDFDSISGSQGMTLAVTPYLGTDLTALYRQRSGNADALEGTYLPATGLYVFDGTNWNRLVDPDWQGSGAGGAGMLSVVPFGVNSVENYDRFRTSDIPYQTGVLRVETSFNYKNISTNDNTVVIDRTGILHTISINTYGTATTATVYDNTSAAGVKIATIDTATTGRSLPPFDLVFLNGLTIATAGTTAADITVTYK